jgi:hypothetical protein
MIAWKKMCFARNSNIAAKKTGTLKVQNPNLGLAKQ